MFGIDYAWGRPGVTAMKNAGVKFVCRYLSHDTTGKNLTEAEAKQLSSADIWIVVVWESSAKRTLSGYAAGVADAKAAEAQAKACEMPAGRPIYFAVDFDASSGQQAAINSYLDGAASVLGRGRVGLYAGYYVIKRAFDAGKIAYGWQTYAWSGGHWDSRAQLQQYSNGHRLNGVGIDYDRSMHADFGQWKVGVSPVQEDDVSAKDVWTYPIDTGDGKAPWRAGTVLGHLEKSQDRIEAKIDALAKIAGANVDVNALAAELLKELSPAEVATAVVAALPKDLAKQVADELATRLEN